MAISIASVVLPVPVSPMSQRPRPCGEVRVEVVDVVARLPDDAICVCQVPRHVGDRRAVEGDAAVAGRDRRGDAAAAAAVEPLGAALAGPRDVFGAEDPAGAVADAERAGLFAEGLGAGDRGHQKSGPAAAASSNGGASPAGCSIGGSWWAWSANLG